MSDVIDVMFLLQFFIVVGILLLELFNVMSVGKFFRFDKFKKDSVTGESDPHFAMKISFMLFIVFFLFYLVGFICLVSYPEIVLFIVLFQLESWLIILHVVFFISALFFYLKERSVDGFVKPQMSREKRGV